MTAALITTSSPNEHADIDRRVVFHEAAGPSRAPYFLFRPSRERSGAPLVVSVHGIARNAAAHAFRLMDEADRHGAYVLAPLFEKARFGQYQQLVDPTLGVRSDHALVQMIADAHRRTQADPQRILLFGFSGGAQFAHRFAMLHPERVASCVLAAAGWYTLPLSNAPYPYGLNASGVFKDRAPDPAAFARIPFHVLVGERDTLRDGSLRQSRLLDSTQGKTRLERARTWVEAMTQTASRIEGASAPTLTLLPGVGHDFTACIETAGLARLVFDFFSRDAALSAAQFE